MKKLSSAEAAKLQRDLRADQASIAQQRDRLEAERRQIASTREWAAFYTPLVETIGIVAVVIAVLIYAGFIVAYSFRHNSGADREVAELLVHQIDRGRPSLLPLPPAPSRVLRLPAPCAEATKVARN